MLDRFPLVKRIDLEIEKPWAPIGLPLESVSVEISRGWHQAFIALGSNMGDKKKYLDDAVKAMDDLDGCRDRYSCGLYRDGTLRRRGTG